MRSMVEQSYAAATKMGASSSNSSNSKIYVPIHNQHQLHLSGNNKQIIQTNSEANYARGNKRLANG